jgi:hypothetical protein
MTDAEIIDIMRRLRTVRAGLTTETHVCREILAEANKLEIRLGRRYLRILELRTAAQEAFITGWPTVCP